MKKILFSVCTAMVIGAVSVSALAAGDTGKKLASGEMKTGRQRVSEEQITEKLKEKVASGEMTQEEMDSKIASFQEHQANGEKTGKGRGGKRQPMTMEELTEKLKEKVASGEMTQEEMDTKIAAFNERQANGEKTGKGRGGKRQPMTLEELTEKLKEKVASGEMTQEEMDSKIAAFNERRTKSDKSNKNNEESKSTNNTADSNNNVTESEK